MGMKEAVTPEKLFYKIGEVAAVSALKPSVLRFWETEFAFLRPQKSRSGQRLYSRDEIETILEIKRLLYTEKLTIEGAKRKMSRKEGKVRTETTSNTITNDRHEVIVAVMNELRDFRDSL
jgi:DNA-binding transcriptional MerR regulator